MTERVPNAHEAALVGLLYAVNQLPGVLTDAGLGRREFRQRAKAISEQGFAGPAVRKAVEAVMAGVKAAVTASTTASSN